MNWASLNACPNELPLEYALRGFRRPVCYGSISARRRPAAVGKARKLSSFIRANESVSAGRHGLRSYDVRRFPRNCGGPRNREVRNMVRCGCRVRGAVPEAGGRQCHSAQLQRIDAAILHRLRGHDRIEWDRTLKNGPISQAGRFFAGRIARPFLRHHHQNV
jgi:hypothetical protein